jgi:uncharacterized metal-binding protein YceD (DUF177 family)
LNFSEKAYVKKGEQDNEGKEEMIMIPENEHEIELSQYLYESIVLHMPYQLVHPNDEQGNSLCNQEMLDRLNEFSADETREKESDPRWHVLKDLKN